MQTLLRMRLHYLTLITLSCVLALAGCANPMKILRNGNIERAYTVSKRQVDRRVASGKDFRGDELKALAAAYQALQAPLIQRIQSLEQDRKPERWLELYGHYQQLLEGRKDIAPYLPLLPELAPFYQLQSLEALTERARLQAGDYCRQQAAQLFASAYEGDKAAARSAFDWLGQGLSYTPEASDMQADRTAMQDLGTVRVLIVTHAPQAYEAQLLAEYLPKRQQTKQYDWLEIHFDPPYTRLDYLLFAEPNDIYVGWDEERSASQTYCKEVQEGTKTVEKKVRVNDSTEVVVKEEIPIMRTVYGTVTTVEQYKYASASLTVWLETPAGDLAISPWSIARSCEWSNRYEICSGDPRALPMCSGFSSMFPSTSDMVRDLASSVRSSLVADLRASFLVESGNRRRDQRRAKELFGH